MIPENLKSSLERYVKDKIPTGGFLRAVLENNLTDAICKADLISLPHIKDIVLYVNNDIPAPCWGSPEKVKAWLKGKV